MKLLLISVQSTISRGGIAVWTDQFLIGCEKHGIAYKLVNTEAVGKRAQYGSAKRNFLDELIRTRRIFRDLNIQLKENTFDIAHLNTSCGNLGLFRDYLIARRIIRKGIPVVTHYHCDIPYWIHNSLNRRYLGKLAKLSCQNMVLCESSRRYLEEQFGLRAVKVPNFIDELLVLDAPRHTKEIVEKVFFAGRVSYAKGAEEMYALAKRFSDITFELVGDVADIVATWEKPDNVLLAGSMPHEKVIAHLDRADLFLFPSHSEGFSVALMESMARGVPAIATDVGANADMLADGCGIIVNIGDVDDMEQAVQELTSAKKREEISRRAVDKVRTAYTTDAVLKLLKALYQGVIYV